MAKIERDGGSGKRPPKQPNAKLELRREPRKQPNAKLRTVRRRLSR